MKHLIILCAMAFMACTTAIKPTITSEEWGTVEEKPVYLFTLTNSNGISAAITNYGGTLVAYNAPDKDGFIENIVLGPTSFEEMNRFPTLGNIIGRFANRIGNASFTLDGVEYTLAANSGIHHIHGGIRGLNRKVWDATMSNDNQSATLSLVCYLTDMEEGYPGNMKITVDYVLNNDNELQIRYTATTDKPTVLNLTNHAYFKLASSKEDVRSHQVRIYADAYTPTDADKIPTGEITPVEGTPFDLRQWTTIGDRLTELPSGYDHNFCVKGTRDNAVLVAELYEPENGRLLQTYTTEPGLQFYTAGRALRAACFEAQHYPDSPNKPSFPSTVLRPSETYTQVTIYKVGLK